MIRPLLTALFLLAGLQAAPARASIMTGSTAGIVVSGAGLTATPDSAVIGAGVEFQVRVAAAAFAVDIGPDAVTYTALSPARLGLARSITLTGLTFTGPAAVISGLDVVVGAGITGIGAANFSFTPDTLRLDLTTAIFAAGSTIVVGLATTPLPGPGAVPEPASLGLLLAGLLGLGACRRRIRA